MSRAFVKEPDSDHADDGVVEKPQSGYPNYMTVSGFNRMKEELEELRRLHREMKASEDDLAVKNRISTVEAEIRYLEKRIHTAIPVAARTQTGTDIRFGAMVELIDENNVRHTFRIVGEDETDAARGLISWVTPLAREMIGKQTGDVLVWERPMGNLELEITGFSYQE
jgi:Transcription elongation factor